MITTNPAKKDRTTRSKRLVAAFVLAAVTAALAACNTTEGVGKDLKSTGKGIEETARENK